MLGAASRAGPRLGLGQPLSYVVRAPASASHSAVPGPVSSGMTASFTAAAHSFSSTSASSAGKPVDLSQEAYRLLVRQRLTSIDHPAGGSLFLLPWDKLAVPQDYPEWEAAAGYTAAGYTSLASSSVTTANSGDKPGFVAQTAGSRYLGGVYPFTPETPLPDPQPGAQLLAKLGQRLTQDLQIGQVLVDVQEPEPEGDKWLPRSVTQAQGELPTLLRERLEGRGVRLETWEAPETVANPELRMFLDKEAAHLCLRDFRANKEATDLFLGDKRRQHGPTALKEFREFAHLPSEQQPLQLRLEHDLMVYRILEELVYTEQNMIGWELRRQRLRFKLAMVARGLLDRAQSLLSSRAEESLSTGRPNNLLMVVRPLVVRELVRLCSDELRLPVSCLADYGVLQPMATRRPRMIPGNNPNNTVNNPNNTTNTPGSPGSVSGSVGSITAPHVGSGWGTRLSPEELGPAAAKDYGETLRLVMDRAEPVHVTRLKWACFGRMHYREPAAETRAPAGQLGLGGRISKRVAEMKQDE